MPEMIKPEMSYADLAENFALFDEWDDRYSYLIDLGRKLPPFPKEFQTEEFKVRGCLSQVWMVPGHPPGQPEKFAFAGDSDGQISKGLIAVLGILFSGQTPEAIAAVDVDEAFTTLGLPITTNRRNGFVAMVEKIKSYAKA
jgi:cysteine desulfuration protein SufE